MLFWKELFYLSHILALSIIITICAFGFVGKDFSELTQCRLQWMRKKDDWRSENCLCDLCTDPLILQSFYHDSDNLLSKIFPFVWIWQNSYSAFSSGSPSSNKQNLWTLDWRKSKFLTFGKFIRPLPIWVDNNETGAECLVVVTGYFPLIKTVQHSDCRWNEILI